MKVMILGDVHGQTGFFRSALERAAELGCEKIVQLGDFGLWWPGQLGERFMQRVDELTAEYELEVLVIDGNHENHSAIRHLQRTTHGEEYSRNPSKLFTLNDYIWYMPRGSVLKLGDTTCLFLGGAVSVDKHLRGPNSWWADEEVTWSDVTAAQAAVVEYKPEVLFCHGLPGNYPVPGLKDLRLIPEWRQNAEAVFDEQKRVGRVVEAAADINSPFKTVYHGHLHVRYTMPHPDVPATLVEGIGHDESRNTYDSYVVVDF